jgi:hypothetical protein
MSGNLWNFTEITTIEETNFNTSLERFYNYGIEGLVRENIQNSLDAKLDENIPVEIIIKTGTISKSEIPGIQEIQNRIECLKGQNPYTKETIKKMKKIITKNQNNINYISFEDKNTKGLTGAKNGQSNNEKDTWGVYAYSKGFHPKDENTEKEKVRGGSHGIGKISSNAASEIYTMFFANCDENREKHLGGTIQLIEHEYEKKYYRSTGYFARLENIDNSKTKFMPYENNNYSKIFEKNTRGLKIIIPYLRENFIKHEKNLDLKIKETICDNFFVSILEEKLKVKIDEEEINKNNINKYIKDIYTEDKKEKSFTPLYYDTYISQSPECIEVKDKNKNSYKFKLYFKFDEEIRKARIAIIRTIGMKIEDMGIKNYKTKPFNGVLIPFTSKEDEFFKSLENESHTKISIENLKDENYKKNSRKVILEIEKEIKNRVDREIRKVNPTDGKMDTKDIIYKINANFEKIIENNTKKVKIKNKSNKYELSKNKSNERIYLKTSSKKSKKKKGNGIRKVIQNSKTKDKEIEIFKVEDYSLVERIILQDYEIIKFDFRKNKELKNKNECDINFSIIDGMGIEYDDEFEIEDNYEKIFDMSNNNICNTSKNKIKNIKIVNNIAQIKLKIKNNYNKTLKFVYSIEVEK